MVLNARVFLPVPLCKEAIFRIFGHCIFLDIYLYYCFFISVDLLEGKKCALVTYLFLACKTTMMHMES